MSTETLNEAIALIKNNRRSEAQPILISLLKENPDNPRAWLWLSRTVSNPDKKVTCLEKCLHYQPDNPYALKELARLQAKTKPSSLQSGHSSEISSSTGNPPPASKNQDGRRWLVASLLAGSGICILMFVVVVVLYNQTMGLQVSTVTLFDEAPPPTPIQALVDANFLEGIQAYEAGYYVEARNFLDLAMNDNPEMAGPYIYLALVNYKEKRFEDGLALAEKGLELDPQAVRAYTTRALFFIERGEFNKAKSDLEYAESLDPGFAYVYMNWGVYYGRQGQNQQAFTMFNRAIALHKTDKQMYLNHALTAFELGQYDTCINSMTNAFALDNQIWDGYYIRGTCHLFNGTYAEAVLDLDVYVDFNPTDACGWKNRGSAHLRLGNEAEARRDFARAEELRC